MKKLAVILLFLASLVTLRCSHAPVTPYGDPDKLWEKVQSGYDRPAGPFTASGTIGLASSDFNHTVDFALRWESAARLRIDLAGPFGISLASAALVDSLAWVSVPLRGTYVSGSLSLVDSAANAGLNLSLDRIMRAVEGLPPRQDGAYQQAVRGKATTEFLFQRGDTARSFTVDQKNGGIGRYSVRIADKPWARLEYDDFRPVAGSPRPHRVRLSSPAAGMTLDLAFDSIKPAQPFPDEIWKQSVPEGISPQRFK